MKIKVFLKGGSIAASIVGGFIAGAIGVAWLVNTLGNWGGVIGLLLVVFLVGGVTMSVLS